MPLSAPTESVKQLCEIDIASMVDWLTAIPFEEWPQQCRPADGRIRPAMMHDLNWHDFGHVTDPIVFNVMSHFPGCLDYNRMLSVVMPGHAIEPHTDAQSEKWVIRLHVPLTTNAKAIFYSNGNPHNMKVGTAYMVNTLATHEIRNDGDCPRIHFMFDVVNP